MTHNLADKLILHYENTIKLILTTNNQKEIRKVLVNTNTNLGLCYCASELLHTSIFEDDWIFSKLKEKGKNKNDYLFPVPCDFNNKENIIDCLQKRVDILKTFKEN